MDSVEILPLQNTRRNIKKFVRFAWTIYRDNPYWVPPLISDQVNFILKGAYLDTGVIQPFMAYLNGKPVGRIIAHYDNCHNKYHHENRGCFGFFECIDDPTVSRALFDAARNWLTQQGMKEMYGPLNFLMYDKSGLLIDDFDSDPPLEVTYNPAYYVDLFLDYGFQKAIDWYAYHARTDRVLPPVLYKMRDRFLRSKNGIRFRDADKDNFWEDTSKIGKCFNLAWKDNWGHIPLSDNHFDVFAKELKPVVKPELIIMAEQGDELVAHILSVPDLNQAIKRANGRLFPFGFLKILWGMRKITRAKISTMGILPEYRGKGLESFFFLETLERMKKMGYKEVDMSVVVETNTPLIDILEKFGVERYKTLRHYTIPISN